MKIYHIAFLLIAILLFFVWPEGESDIEGDLTEHLELETHNESKPNIKEQNLPEQSDLDKEVLLNQSLAKAAQQVSMQYEKTISYPHYSQPLSALDEDRLEPNKFFPVSSPLENDAGDVTIKLEKYRFIYPEKIRLNITGPNLTNVKVKLTAVDNNEPIAQQYAKRTEDGFVASFEQSKLYPRNCQIIVTTHINSKKIPVVAQIQYMQESAHIIDFEQAYPNGSDMVIPAIIEVKKAGLYRLRANLFNGTEPLAHLVNKGKLNEGTQTVELKAHWSVFKAQHTQLNLSGFVIERMSPSPSEPSIFGDSKIDSFDITDFQYDSLQQTDYTASEQEQKSLEFLRSLADKKSQ